MFMTTKKGIIEAKKRNMAVYNGGKDTEKELRQKIQKQSGLQSANALAELMRRHKVNDTLQLKDN